MNRHSWLRGGLLVAGVVAAGAWLAVARAQPAGERGSSTPTPIRIYTRKTVFQLPVILEDQVRAALQEVRLYVKVGSAPWLHKESAPPTQPHFVYRAAQDGEYAFTVVTVDKAGKVMPSDVSREPPGLTVVVDTQPPQVTVRALPSPDGEVWLQCEVHDANPDLASVKLECQSPDKTWRALTPCQPGMFRLTGSQWPRRVRATAGDRAGNTTTRVIELPPPPPAAPAVGPALAQSVPSPEPVIQPASLPPPAPPPSIQPAVQHPTEPPALPPVQGDAAPPERQVVNSTHASVAYQVVKVGPSGVGKVEVWLTRDRGQTWQRLGEDPDRRSPVDIDLPGEGLFGISLVVSNGNGFGGTPPAAGDSPDWWIEVDLTKPDAQLRDVQVASENGVGTVVINWTARDKNLTLKPIDLYYAAQREGPWLPMARGLRNEGRYSWPVPADVGPQLFIRLDATDEAGNTTRCETPEPVLIDRTRPKARVLGAVTSGPRPRGMGPAE